MDESVEGTVNGHSKTSYSPYRRTPFTKSQHGQSSMSSSLKRTRSPSDVGDQAHSVHVRIEEPLRLHLIHA